MLSVCMIVKNEEGILSRCLDCLDFADEIIIVDTGSTDSTKEIAYKYTDKVYDFEWIDDFSAARNFSFNKSIGDYIMWIDADDIMPLTSQESIANLELTADAYMLPYQVAFDENNNCTFEYYRERIVKRGLYTWNEPVHECMALYGNIQHIDIPIEHRPNKIGKSERNLNIYRAREQSGETLSPRAMFYYARELKEHGYNLQSKSIFEEFLKTDGWYIDKINACMQLSELYAPNSEAQLQYLFNSMQYDIPNSEICCKIASIYFNNEEYEKSIFWYETALNCKKPEQGFVKIDFLRYIPNIMLCVCYDRIGDKEKSIYHNEQAGKIKPEDKSYLQNKEYFERSA